MRVLVCGSRSWSQRGVMEDALRALLQPDKKETIVLIHGAAGGADRMSGEIARSLNATERAADFAVREFPANWRKYGKAAGAIRNQQMLDEGKPDLVLAFWDGVSRGTKDMIERSKKAGVPVRVIS